MSIEQSTFDRIQALLEKEGPLDNKESLMLFALAEINDGVKKICGNIETMKKADEDRKVENERKFQEVHFEISTVRDEVKELKTEVEEVRKDSITSWIKDNRKVSIAIFLVSMVLLKLFIDFSTGFTLQEMLDFLSNFI